VIWRAFRTSRPQPQTTSWWRDAESAADAPTADVLDRLRSGIVPHAEAPDEAERQEEMLDGLGQLQAVVTSAALPVLITQHRVIGADVCHFVAPVSLAGDVAVPGKLFLTAERLVFAGGRVQAWSWHRVYEVTRSGRMLAVVLAGGAEGLRVQCNTYGDALVARHVAGRIRGK
jgi:hypothetical protein